MALPRLAEQRQSLEREKESYRLELVSSKAQTQSMTEVLQKQDTMLAEKVCRFWREGADGVGLVSYRVESNTCNEGGFLVWYVI